MGFEIIQILGAKRTMPASIHDHHFPISAGCGLADFYSFPVKVLRRNPWEHGPCFDFS